MPKGIYPRPSAKERFWNKVIKQRNGCWQWLGYTLEGYGVVWSEGKRVGTHRLSFQWANGAIPNGMTLDHLCRNHACVNPDHLEVVTRKENVLRGIGVTAIHSRATKCQRTSL